MSPTRPKTVPVVAAFLLAATVIAVVTGFSLLFPNPLLDTLWKLNPAGARLFHSIGPASGIFLLALGVFTIAAARGLLQGRPWAWWFSVALFATDAGGNLVSYFLIHDALRTVTGAVVSSAFLFFLCRRRVRDYFICPGPAPGRKP